MGMLQWLGMKRQQYEAVATTELEEGEALPPRRAREKASTPRTATWVWYVGLAILILATAIVVSAIAFTHLATSEQLNASNGTTEQNLSGNVATRCPQRREWRSLQRADQQRYISAVRCLLSQPSSLAPNTNYSAYDDWPWTHAHAGYLTHHSASFLPWHRYFLHLYETTLREKCSYDGALVYWDWTLDSDALETSPVFDPETGFGGDGMTGGKVTVGNTGRCVVDGPFADVFAKFYDVKPLPHCLSRGFRTEKGELGHMDGEGVSPETIDSVLNADKYEDFVELMEEKVHDVIPFGISGDFETFTAPYDPLFFLHHTQLDRLWYLWQQRDPSNRLFAYGGHRQRHSMQMATLEDAIDVQKLAPSVKVNDVMDTRGVLLCYSY